MVGKFMGVLFYFSFLFFFFIFPWEKVPVTSLHCHSVQGMYGTHLAGIAICSSIHLPVKWILYNPCTG